MSKKKLQTVEYGTYDEDCKKYWRKSVRKKMNIMRKVPYTMTLRTDDPPEGIVQLATILDSGSTYHTTNDYRRLIVYKENDVNDLQ